MTRTDKPTASLDARGPAAFDELLRRERQSVQITLNQPTFVPGVFQVEGYAAEMIGRMRALKPGDHELTERVQIRMRRADGLKERLQGEAPPRVSVLIDEAALRRVVGGKETMRRQLAHLSELSKLPTVELAIVPKEYGAYAGLTGPFEVHHGETGPATVYFEAPTDKNQVLTDDEAEVNWCREIVEAMKTAVVSGADARALLETISGEL